MEIIITTFKEIFSKVSLPALAAAAAGIWALFERHKYKNAQEKIDVQKKELKNANDLLLQKSSEQKALDESLEEIHQFSKALKVERLDPSINLFDSLNVLYEPAKRGPGRPRKNKDEEIVLDESSGVSRSSTSAKK